MKIDDQRSIPAPAVGRPVASGPTRPEGSRATDEAKTQANAASQPAARVELSGRARELAAARAAVEATPDVRADKVADAKQRIANGTYAVDGEQIARRMLDRRA